MIKCRIYIRGNEDFMEDDRLFVDIELPALPRKGDCIFGIDTEYLNNIAQSDINIAKDYPMWFNNRFVDVDKIEKLGPEHLEYIDFFGAFLITNIWFNANDEYVQIQIDSTDHTREEEDQE
jgi:hypothetical protein